MSHLALPNKPKLPITLYMEPSLKAKWFDKLVEATAAWNSVRPCFAVSEENVSPDKCNVRPDDHTWVNMPAGILYIGRLDSDWYTTWWLKHELGHLLLFGDHINRSIDPTLYINPEFCQWPDDEYKGIMSYCYHNGQITEQDKAMLLREYPLNLPFKTRIPGVARDT